MANLTTFENRKVLLTINSVKWTRTAVQSAALQYIRKFGTSAAQIIDTNIVGHFMIKAVKKKKVC